MDEPEPPRLWSLGSGDDVRPGYIEPDELAEGDFRCRCWAMKLCTDDGREMNSSRSEFGVLLPNDRLLGSLLCLETGTICSIPYDDDGSNPICVDVIDERLELTLLDLRDETEARFALFPLRVPTMTDGRELLDRRFIVPRLRPAMGLVPGLPTLGWGYARLCASSAGGGALRLPLASSLNQSRNVDRRLARLRPCGIFPCSPIVGNEPRESPGELEGVAGGECLEPPAMTHGEPAREDSEFASKLAGGVLGPSFKGLSEGDFRSLIEPEDRVSSPLVTRLSLCLSLSLSLSLSSRTPSADFFLTRPAASRAVVARCMMLTLPDRPLRLLDPSLSFMLPLGVLGWDLLASDGVADVGDSIGFVGDTARGGVMVRIVLGAVGVAGINASSGAECAATSTGTGNAATRSSCELRALACGRSPFCRGA